jgi:hypothetical protein
MKPEKYRRGQALRVFWVDSTQSQGWRYDENPSVHVENVATLGFFVNSDLRGINMTSTLSDAGGSLSLVTIPWQAITDIQDISDWDQFTGYPGYGQV